MNWTSSSVWSRPTHICNQFQNIFVNLATLKCFGRNWFRVTFYFIEVVISFLSSVGKCFLCHVCRALAMYITAYIKPMFRDFKSFIWTFCRTGLSVSQQSLKAPAHTYKLYSNFDFNYRLIFVWKDLTSRNCFHLLFLLSFNLYMNFLFSKFCCEQLFWIFNW